MIFALKLMCAIGATPSFYGPLLALLEEQSGGTWAPLVNVGAVGVCLVALAGYYIRKDAGYERRIDQALEREKAFGEKYADLAEKYRTALEKTNSTLDTVLQLLRQQTPGR